MSDRPRRALICGIGGQDGSLLAKYLLEKGYMVWGTSRDAEAASFRSLTTLEIRDKIQAITMLPKDFRSVYLAIKRSQADEVYFLAGQTSVGLSFELPAETMESITIGILNVLEACRASDRPIKVFHAGSSECFGNTDGYSADESTPFHPKSPYAVAKASAIWLVDNYREAYGVFACSGILFNHESRFRPERFVTQKIIHGAKLISQGKLDMLRLGNINVSRDWGWAPEYVEAMWMMLQQDIPENFVIATGETNSLEAFIECVFSGVGLDWKKYVSLSDENMRPSDIKYSSANPSKAKMKLGWSAKYRMKDIVQEMLK